VFFCNSLRDFCVSSLVASSYLPVFSCISLREVCISFLKSYIIIMRSDFRSISCFCGVMVYQDLLWWKNFVLMMPCKLGFCCFCCLLPSDYLRCLLPPIYLIGSSPSYNPSWFRTPQSPALSVILWLWAPVNLRFWVCQSFWQSSFLWDPVILVWPTSCYPGILLS
jgi:hypothetical protein